MYTLYYAAGACSMGIHVALNEIGAEFQLEQISFADGQNRSPEFLKINSRGQIPVLKDDELTIREGAAILLHLLEKHKSPLLPSSGNERAAALEWLMFCNATLHPAYGRCFFLMKNAGDNTAAKDHYMKAAVASINTLWQDVETHLATQPYLAGSQVTIGDILLSVIAGWSKNVPGIEIGAKTKQLISQVSARPSFQKAIGVEQVDYKIAA